jgi:exportin-2 (importin alpha re-exporter)
MEINDQTLASLHDVLQKSLSPDNTARKAAEVFLNKNRSQPGIPLLTLSLITRLTTVTTPLEVAIRQSAAVYFKNIIKEHWEPEEGFKILQNEKDTIKTHVVELMTSAPPDVQKQLGEAVSIIAKYDFPKQWETLLPQLVSKLNTTDMMTIKGVMLTANSIMKRYRYVAETNDLLLEIKYCLDRFALPLLHQYQQTSQKISQFEHSKPDLVLLFESLRLMTRIFFSLNWQDIPEVFEDNSNAWMSEFAKFLTYKNPLLTDKDSEPGPIQSLQAAILENLNLYANKYEEEFTPFLPQFTDLVWKLLLEIDDKPKYDHVATGGIKFLTAVASKQMNSHLFNDQTLKMIIEQIIVKNITATENDEELFENNPSDYIRKDMEGSDQDTRRRSTIDLIRALMKFFNQQIASLCLSYINVLLEQYQQNTKNWKAKDAALHIVLALAVQNTNPMTGVSELNSAINIVGIFETHVLPEVHDSNINARPIVKADAIKLICILRNHFPKQFIVSLLPHVIRYLQSESVVVQTYAAMCVEKFFFLKDKDATTGVSTPRIAQLDILPFFQPLFGGLFAVLENPELTENEYVMKCIMRSLILVGDQINPVTDLVVSHLLKSLEKVCKNPVNPNFNHYLFESLAVLIKSTCGNAGNSRSEMQVAACNQFESILFPIFQTILTQDISEFIPYTFQIFAQLLAARPLKSGLSDAYRALFPPLLVPVLWERKGNVPGLIDLFKAYISRGMDYIITNNHLEGVLGVFQKLLSVKSTEASAFQLMNTIYAFTPYQAIARYMPTILGLELTRMQEHVKHVKVQPYCRLFLHSICVLSSIYGAQVVYEALEGQTPNLVAMIVTNIWSPNAQNCANSSKSEKKDFLIGGTKLLLESNIRSHPDVFKSLLSTLLTIATLNENEKEFSFDHEEHDEIKSFDTTYSKLAHSSIYHLDINTDIQSGSKYFITTLTEFFRSSPNHVGVIQQLSPQDQKSFQTLNQTA